MVFRKSLVLGLCAAMLFSASALAGEKKEGGEKKGPSNEIKATVPTNYIQLPRFRLGVPEDSTAQYRQLEVETWISATGEEHIALLNSSKKKISAAIKEDFASYRWEAFAAPDTGIEVAKKVVANAVERSVGFKPDEVIMKTLLLR